MQFSISTVIFSVALATLGLAAPTPNPSAVEITARSPAVEELGQDANQFTKRKLGVVFICPAFDWQPESDLGCSNINNEWKNQCTTFGTYYKRVSAVGPDRGTYCRLYTSGDCKGGESQTFTYPGISRLEGYWGTWNDNVGSMKCWW